MFAYMAAKSNGDRPSQSAGGFFSFHWCGSGGLGHNDDGNRHTRSFDVYSSSREREDKYTTWNMTQSCDEGGLFLEFIQMATSQPRVLSGYMAIARAPHRCGVSQKVAFQHNPYHERG